MQVGLTEVLLKNKAGTWLTAQVADLPAAASQLFQSGGWPANPTDDFSGEAHMLSTPSMLCMLCPCLFTSERWTASPHGTLLVVSNRALNPFQSAVPFVESE